MTQRRRSAPERLGRLLSGLARQLDLPVFGGRSAAPRRPAAPAIATRSIRLADRTLDYTLRRARRKSIGFSIGVGGLTVAAPQGLGVRRIEDAIRERERWVVTKLDEVRRHRASIPQVRWEDGGTVPYLGEALVLRVERTTTPSGRGRTATFARETRTLSVVVARDAPESAVRERVTAWLQAEARALFAERLAFYEARLGRRHRVLRLSSAKTRWGSCSADGRILLNWRLIHLPPPAVDYVVAHELAHLKEMNHGPRFWATVASIMPDYEAARDHVKNPPPALLPTL